MAATTIFFNGRTISVPGSYSEVDASGLEQVGLGAAGIVAAIGTAEGGIPVTDIEELDDYIRIKKPEAGRSEFRSGDLREVIEMLFAPSADGDIQGGAVEVVCMKVNPATQSSASFSNSQGNALDLESVDYGAFTEQINVSIASGTTKGKLVTIIFEDTTEAVDDLGGDTMFSLKYTKPTNGWDTMTGQCLAGGIIQALGTRATLGMDSDIGTTLAAPGAIEVVSASGADITQTVTVYGLDGTGAPVSETLTLTGAVAAVGTQVFAAGDVLGAAVTGTTAGNVSVRPSGGGADVFTITAGADPVAGLVRGSTMYAASVLTLVSSGASTKDVIISGRNTSGAATLEKITLTGAVAVAGLGVFSEITAIVLGDVEVAQTITSSATAVQTTPAIQNTLQRVLDYFNARQISGPYGFVATMVTSQTSLDPDNLDVMVAAITILDPAEHDFLADLYAIVAWVNQNSALITAAAATGASGGAPDNTTSPVFLQGGSEGSPITANWQTALNLLKQTRVNSVVALTGDPAIHAMVEAHCAYMGGIGRSERDACLGALNTALTDVPTKTEFKAQVVDLNSRHTRLAGQSIERFNTSSERTTFMPPFTAAVAAGMQAGSAVGESLTYKFANVLSIKSHSSWNPTDDAEEMIRAGCLILENVEGVGRRWVRNITTHLSSSNIAYTEASVNEAVNYSVFNFRTNMEFAVGKKGFSGTVNGGKAVAISTLGLLVDGKILVEYRSIDVELIVDVMEVSAELAPVIPINFVKSTIHLVTVRQSAA